MVWGILGGISSVILVEKRMNASRLCPMSGIVIAVRGKQSSLPKSLFFELCRIRAMAFTAAKIQKRSDTIFGDEYVHIQIMFC